MKGTVKVIRRNRTSICGWAILDGNGFDRFHLRTFWAWVKYGKTR